MRVAVLDEVKINNFSINMESKVVILCTVLVLASAITQLSTEISSSRKYNNTNQDNINNIDEVCVTQECNKTANAVRSKIDLSVNPCDNFYKFACGNFLNTTKIPKDKEEVNEFTILNDKVDLQLKNLLEEPPREDELKVFEKVKIYYKNCMDTDKIEKSAVSVFKSILEEFGGWPVLTGENWNVNNFDWKTLLYRFHDYGFGADHLIQLFIYTDIKNNSQRIIYVGVPSFGLDDEFLKKGATYKVVQAYYNFMVELVVALGGNEERARTEMKEMLDFEISLANHTLPAEQKRNKSIIYNRFTIDEVQKKYPSIPWLEYINSIMPSEVQVNDQENVILPEPKYLKNLEEILKVTPKRTLANYLVWKIVSLSTDYLPDKILNIDLKFKQTIYGVEELSLRWNRCIKDVNISLRNLVGAYYVRRYFGQEPKKEILNTLKYIRKEFNRILKANDWMDNTTKEFAVKKLNAMAQHVAYPDELLDDDLLTREFEGIEVLPGEYLKSALSINRYLTNFDNKRLREQVNKTEWISHADTTSVNAFFSQVQNAIILPAGILQGHFFGLGRPRYMNFGALGSLVGHEITHGYDDVGRQFDSIGNLKDWWIEEAREAFLEKANCIIEQYGNYTVPEVNMTINGKRTQGENIADNGGVKLAYFAYQSWHAHNEHEAKLPNLNYTANQMFWISMAQTLCHKVTVESLRYQVLVDTHSPQEYRVIVPFGNIKEFSKDFNCPVNSMMNPNNKCKVW